MGTGRPGKTCQVVLYRGSVGSEVSWKVVVATPHPTISWTGGAARSSCTSPSVFSVASVDGRQPPRDYRVSVLRDRPSANGTVTSVLPEPADRSGEFPLDGGDGPVRLNFTDADRDGFLSAGDTFTLHGHFSVDHAQVVIVWVPSGEEIARRTVQSG